MLSLGKTLNAINTDRHRKVIINNKSKLQTTEESNHELKNTIIKTRNIGTQTSQISTKNISCDTAELQKKQKEEKALAAFKKRIAEQKIKAQQMKQFLGNTNNIDEDNIEDE
tara:strand:+ start:658 stop:993 length:336 start_codon:yes stop_codon:yes gene_type:complete